MPLMRQEGMDVMNEIRFDICPLLEMASSVSVARSHIGHDQPREASGCLLMLLERLYPVLTILEKAADTGAVLRPFRGYDQRPCPRS